MVLTLASATHTTYGLVTVYTLRYTGHFDPIVISVPGRTDHGGLKPDPEECWIFGKERPEPAFYGRFVSPALRDVKPLQADLEARRLIADMVRTSAEIRRPCLLQIEVDTLSYPPKKRYAQVVRYNTVWEPAWVMTAAQVGFVPPPERSLTHA